MGDKKRNPAAQKAAYHAVRAVFWLMYQSPRNVALAIGRALGGLLWLVLRLERKRLRYMTDHMRLLFPEAPERELRRFAKRVCHHWGYFAADSARGPLFRRETFERRVRFEGLDHFREAYAKGKGVVLATAHFGHMELGAGSLGLMGYPVWSVIRTVDNPHVDELLDGLRASIKVGVIKKENASAQIISHLRLGHVVTIHTDLHAAFNNVFVKFLGRWTATFSTPAVVSLRTGAPALSMFCFREKATDTLRVRFVPLPPAPSTGSVAADVRRITLGLNAALEDAIREAPEQWFWLHKRWKMQPKQKDLDAIEKHDALIAAAGDGAQK